ncbi:hypothetical protein [Halorussus halophilus]|uniref:hypothetical protein n=1 Tax=Halorussus halophilus TaxID=2650975 RepID=UPI0013011D39|nr:hypothetical protein [Halorussus halophilus]
MNYRTKVNAIAGGLVAIGFGGVPGALLGGGLAGYLEGRDVFESGVAGVGVALVAVVGLLLFSFPLETVRHGNSHWLTFLGRILTQSLHVAFWATVGGGVGGYVNRETGI